MFVTKYRHRVSGDRHFKRTEEITRAVCADFEAVLFEFHGAPNSVHLQVNLPPKVAVSKLVNTLKGLSSHPSSSRTMLPRARLGSLGGPPHTRAFTTAVNGAHWPVSQ